MKIRNGFVSNSSSSSFIITGVKISNDEYKEKIENSWKDFKDLGLCEHEDRYYFSDEEASGHIIGVNVGNMEDGVVSKIKQLTDEKKDELIEKLKSIGIERSKEEIETYVQFISNDNY